MDETPILPAHIEDTIAAIANGRAEKVSLAWPTAPEKLNILSSALNGRNNSTSPQRTSSTTI